MMLDDWAIKRPFPLVSGDNPSLLRSSEWMTFLITAASLARCDRKSALISSRDGASWFNLYPVRNMIGELITHMRVQ